MDEVADAGQAAPVELPGSLLSRPQWEDGAWVWRFRRNCALSPAQLFSAFAGFALFSVLLGLFCQVQGATLALPFVVIEVVAMGWAFVLYARHAADYERIAISADAVHIEWMHGARLGSVTLPARSVRVQAHGRGLVQVTSRQTEVHIGRHLRPERRMAFARDLRRAILTA